MAEKRRVAGSLASLFRQAGQDAKQEDAASSSSPQQAKIFSILEYIEASWGLNMKLRPAQRAIVKLYYHLELDTKLPEEEHRRIRIKDPFSDKILYTFSEKEYLEFLFTEGRCNIKEQDHERRELVLAIGRRGGKCLREGSVVLTDAGFYEIQELGDPEGPEYQPLQVGVAQEGSRKSESAFFYNGGTQDTICVRSHCGLEIEGTPNHRVRVMTEAGVIQWRFLGDVRVGDRLGVHRKTDLWPTQPVDLKPFRASLPGCKKVPLPDALDESWGTLLGVLVGDGTWNRRGQIEVTVGPYPEWLTQVQEVFRSTVGDSRIRMERRTRRAFWVQFDSTWVREFLNRLGFQLGVQSHLKRVPWAILRSPKTVVAAFLRGLFETDGCVEDERRLSFSTASFRLASEVQLLLLNFGIVSRIKERLNKRYGRTYFHLTVLGAESVRTFADQIGFLSECKKSLLEARVRKGALGNKSSTEAIPFQQTWCRRLLESVPKNNGNAAVGKLGWRRSALRSALGNVIKNSGEDLSYPRLRVALGVAREVGADPETIRHFEELLEAGYFYDAVTSVTSSRGQVYDLTVPDGEAFVANGFTNHNTTLSGIFASYEVYRLLNLYNPQAYFGLPNGNRIQIISVATDKDQAGLLFNEVTGHLAKCEYFKPYIANNTLSHVNFRTPYDIERFGPTARQENGKFVSFNGKASLRVTFKSCIAKGLRGSGNYVIILDEVAHFQDKGNSSAEQIYEAVTPSAAAYSKKDPVTGEPEIDPFGNEAPVESRIILISSPLGRSGKFFEKFDLAMHGGEGAENILAIQAPTWEINPTIPSAYFRQKYAEKPSSFMVEFGASFQNQETNWIEREVDLLACVDETRRPVMRAAPRVPHQMGIDVGLVEDGTAVAITHVEGDKIVLDYHELWIAGNDWNETNPHLHGEYSTNYAKGLQNEERLDFEEIADWIQALTKRFHITAGVFDRWTGIALEQKLHKKGLKQFRSEHFTRDLSSQIYQRVKMFLYDEKLVLYDYPIPERAREGSTKHSQLISEILALQANQVSKNIVIVSKPKKRGARDDQSDAYARSVWLSIEAMLNTKHVSHGSVYRPNAGNTVNIQSYQRMRARNHGIVGERSVRRSGRQLVRSR